MANQNPIRVMVVDDHGMIRRGLAAYLKNMNDLELVAEARDGQDAVQVCEQIMPDVILMDLVMPGVDGVTATRIIRQRWPQVQVIALTSFQERELIQNALQAGAVSYLLKNVSGDDLAEAIRAAHAGRSTLAPEAIQALIQPALIANSNIGLTDREREVLSLLVKGLSNPEIAEHLNVSRATVKVHVSNILGKLGVSNRAEAIAFAIQNKLIS
jgi:NarL family two-component system response regulator LiaR